MTAKKKYPFKFLDAYDRKDRDLYFGRDEEIEALYQMVYQTDLILICGASGTGKTSLIQCGLASKFQPYEWLALNIRRGKDINESLEKALADASNSEQTDEPDDELSWLEEEETMTAVAESTITQQLKQLYLRHFKPVFLIFDQFEELYILGSETEQQQFVTHVRDMLRIEQPVKIIISIREEYLGFLYEFERKVPELLHKKLRIEPMHLEKVKEVVRGMGNPSRSLVELAATEADRFGELVFKKLRGHENVRTIELPYLQVLLDKLYLQITQDDTHQTPALFTLAELKKMGDLGDLLANFLDEQVQKNARKLRTTPETIKKLLAPFVTLDGTKAPLSAEMLHSRLSDQGLTAEFISRCLQAFESSQILRFDEKEQRYEVKHDSLARQIATYQDAEDIALQKAGQVIRTQLLLEAEQRDVFTEKQLLFIEPFLEKLQLTSEEQRWVDHSRQHWADLRAAADRKHQEELTATQKRLRLVRGLLFGAVLALLIAGYAGWQARVQSKAAQQSEQKALEASATAQEKLLEALLEKKDRLTVELENARRSLRVYRKADHEPLINETQTGIQKLEMEIAALENDINQADE